MTQGVGFAQLRQRAVDRSDDLVDRGHGGVVAAVEHHARETGHEAREQVVVA